MSTRDRIVEALSAEVSPLRDDGVALAVDYVLDLKIADVVDLQKVHGIVLPAFTKENAARIVARHVRPGYDRFTATVEKSEEAVGGFVPDPARIRDIVAKSRLPHAEWAKGMVDPVLMRRLFAPVWANLLLNFAKRLPIPGVGTAASGAAAAASGAARGVGGIAERLSRTVQGHAEKLVDASRSVMGGLGAEVEKRLQSAARDFSDGAAGLFREALRDRMKSHEGRELIAQISAQVIDHVMVTKLADIHKDAKYLPVPDILDLGGEIAAHSASRAFIRDLVAGEIRAFLDAEGARTLREQLTELGILDATRDEVLAQANRVARGFFTTPAFGDWLGRLLDA
jgi:hypothetical protein